MFTAAFVVTGAIEIYLFVRLHDVVHYPGHSMLERLPGFLWLDRHHYLHHVDMQANVNFLLPLADWLFGTLRREMTPREPAIYPAFEAARGALAPVLVPHARR